jgi:hypothetical protein
MTRRVQVCLLVVLFLFVCSSGFAQVGNNATLSGTVSDATGALIPGVEVTARNSDTGLVSTVVTNESGTYRFASLPPGSYELSAALPGFQPQTFRLTLGTAQQIRQNFTLQVGGVAQAVEVTVAADQLLTAASASVGNVLPSTQLVDLPLVGRNVMDLVTATMPGVRGNGNPDTTFAGITANSSGNVGISMDGVTMNTGRHTQGLKTASFINPDMVDEMQVVVAPVDVEGRGAAQIQMRTRSGTNNFRGALTWNIRNSKLDSNTWSNNRLNIDPVWYNRHQYTASVGGPIVRSKTFFFALFDRQDMAQKENVDAIVLTPTARQGIFRFFPGVNNGNADVTPTGSGNTRVAPVVDRSGNPLDWSGVPGATGPMRSFTVFGDTLNPGDPVRTRMDTTGYIAKIIQQMPLPNAYDGAATIGGTSVDGLNTAVHRWVRRTVGGSAGGTGQNIDAYNRQQFNVKIDHQFNTNHRLSGTWIRESHYTDNNNLSPWPTGYDGEIREFPRVFSLNVTSTLSPTILNEFRYGHRRTTLHWSPAIEVPEHAEAARAFMPEIDGYPVYIRPTMFNNHVLGASGDLGNVSPMTTWTDTLSWTRSNHALKFGVEFRYANTRGYQASGLIPSVGGGAGDIPVRGIDTIGGLLPSNITLAQNLLLMLSGSVEEISQTYETREPTDTAFLDYHKSYHHPTNPKNTRGRIRDNYQNEFNFFIKDDWKVTPNFTLNMGVRWDLFRVPGFRSASGANWTRGPLGGSEAYFGVSGRTFAEAFHTGGGPFKADLTRIVLIGEGTEYPKQGLWRSDKNNFSPALGFSWAPGFGGREKTTIRGGYQLTHLLPGNSLSWIDADQGLLPGLQYSASDSGGGTTYRDLTSIRLPLPLPLTPESPVTIPITHRSSGRTFFDPNYTTPYVQTFTMGVTRSLPSSLILDVRYVATRGVKLHSTLNYNEPDFRFNGLMEALTVTRAGGNHVMFDRMLNGLNLGTGIGVVGRDVTGSEALRRHASFRGNIANGDFRAVANTLNTTNIGVSVPAGETYAGGTLRSSGLFPENFITANPQFTTMEMRNNSDTSMYHSMQTQLTMRPLRGVTYQATWTWSRATGVSGSTPSAGGVTATYRDFLNRNADYTISAFHRVHDLRGYGMFELPFGPGKWLGTNSGGLLGGLIGGWQLGTIFSLNSGAPLNVAARNTINRTGTPDIVGGFERNGGVAWDSPFGSYFSEQYTRVPDPACANVASNLRLFCTNTAIADAGGNIILQNAAPGQLGTLGLLPIYGPGSWDLDANLQKTIRVTESKNLTIRLDATNIFNHPSPGNPNLDINAGTFGQITTKNGNRTLAAQIRLAF